MGVINTGRGLPHLILGLMFLLMFLMTGCSWHAVADVSRPVDPLSMLIQLYRGPLDHLSAVRRGTTPMYPATSVYALESLQKHGPLVGVVMTCDRLLRAGRDEVARAPLIAVGGRLFSYDPVSANDFWWNLPLLPASLPIPGEP